MMIHDSLCTCRSGPCKLYITCHLTYHPLSQNLYNCALISSRWNSPQSFLKVCLLGFNPRVDLSKIFHFFLGRLLINFCQHLLIIQRFKTSSVLASPMAQWVKNLPAMQDIQEMRVWPLGWEYSLEEEMAIHSSILAWKIPWTEDPSGIYSPRGQGESDMTEWLSTHNASILKELYY